MSAGRRISLSIAPATDTTCGDGSGRFCPFMTTRKFGQVFECSVFNRELRDQHGALSGEGWLQRLDECKASEVK